VPDRGEGTALLVVDMLSAACEMMARNMRAEIAPADKLRL
jgi:hypothetical protein